MNFDQAMQDAMNSTVHYKKPSSNAPKTKRNIVSQGVAGIATALEEEAQYRASKKEKETKY